MLNGLSDDEILELLERAHLHGGGGRLRLEGLLFLGEGIDAFARLDSRLADGADLEDARKDEFTDRAFFDVGFDDIGQGIKNGSDLFAAEFGAFGDLIQDLRLGKLVFDGSDFLGHAAGITECDRFVKETGGAKRLKTGIFFRFWSFLKFPVCFAVISGIFAIFRKRRSRLVLGMGR